MIDDEGNGRVPEEEEQPEVTLYLHDDDEIIVVVVVDLPKISHHRHQHRCNG